MDNTTSPQDKKKLVDYLAKIKSKRKKESGSESDGIDQFKDSKKEDQNIKSYIEFVSFCLQEKMSYNQISRLGQFLQSLSNKKQLKFLKAMTFDKEALSKFVSQCLRPNFLEELNQILKEKLYSFNIDNSTICGEHYCALKVKYLAAQKDEEYQCEITTIQNKLIGISKLEENATSVTLYKIVKEKLFYDEEIKKNCIGITHDRGSNIVGCFNGLLPTEKKIRKDSKKYFFSLNDPCHSLNLVVKHSIQSLPKAMINFIIKIHNHFVSPERRATLLRIQAEHNFQDFIKKMGQYKVAELR